MKFDVKPSLTIRPDQSVSGNVKVSTNKWGNEWSVTVSDDCIKDGLSVNGLHLGLKAKTLEVSYAVDGHKPCVILRSNVNINDKDVAIKYTHNVTKGSQLEASVAVDDDNKAIIQYDLAGYDGPDYKKMVLKWAHTQKDFVIEPAFNLGTESLSAKVTYTADDENKLMVSYDLKSNQGALEWTNTSGFGGDGALKITAKSVLDADSIKKMPTIMVEKTWALDV